MDLVEDVSASTPTPRLSPESVDSVVRAQQQGWFFSFCSSGALVAHDDDDDENGTCCASLSTARRLAARKERIFLPRLASLVRYSSPTSPGRDRRGSLSGSVTEPFVVQARRNRTNSLSRQGSNREPEVVRKLVMLGARDSGKSSVALRFAEKRFGATYDPTIENSLRAQISFSGITFICDLLDTAGQDEYSTFSRQSLLGVHGFCLVFSITSLQTFLAAQKIHERLSDLVGYFAVPIVLVGAKCDDETRRQVTKAQGEALAESWGCSYVECSAKSNYGIDEIFVTLLVEIERDSGLLDLGAEPSEVSKSGGCVMS